jgi:MFS family permease
MTVIPASPGSMVPSPSLASLSGLDGLNFFIAGMLAGFGPYVAVYLADQEWTQEDIGFALTAGGLAALISQLPGGELVDIVRSKRVLVAVATVLVAASAVIIGFRPAYPLVLTSLALQGVTGGFLGPSITAISLGLVGLSTLSDRLGRNQRFASIGNLATTGLMGLIAYFLSYRAIFIVVAALSLPIFAALAWIDPADIHFGRSCGAPNHHATGRPPRINRRSLWKNSRLLVFGTSLFLFQLANASVLPLIGESLVYRREDQPSLIMSALIILPQIIVAVTAPWIGREARSWGRRPLLLIGFGALPIRAVLFAWVTNPLFLLGTQLLDGVSSAAIGVLTALVIADITNGSGRFNLAQGIVGTASGIGASLSTSLFGFIATDFGYTFAFLSIASVGGLAALTHWLLMPETKPSVQRNTTL